MSQGFRAESHRTANKLILCEIQLSLLEGAGCSPVSKARVPSTPSNTGNENCELFWLQGTQQVFKSSTQVLSKWLMLADLLIVTR
jgi:hypothetical protein